LHCEHAVSTVIWRKAGQGRSNFRKEGEEKTGTTALTCLEGKETPGTRLQLLPRIALEMIHA